MARRNHTADAIIIGGGYQGRAEPDRNRTHLDFSGLAANAATAVTLFPTLRGVRVVRCWAAIEGHMPDGIPVIGASAAAGAYHAFGFCGHGFAPGPIVGRIIADLVAGGDARLPIGAFDIGRFCRPQANLFGP